MHALFIWFPDYELPFEKILDFCGHEVNQRFNMVELGTTDSDSEEFAEVKEWLESCSLSKYFSGFKKHDYDDLKLIREMNEK